MAKLPTYEELGKKVAEEALGYIYMGKTLKEWIDAVKQTRWIPCIEQAPTTSDEYLITWTCEWNGKLIRSISIAEYDAEAEEWNTDADIRNYSNEVGIIAWMPLPEPYKEAEDEQI